MPRDLFERFASAALELYGPRGPFEIEVVDDDVPRTVAAFEGLGCSVAVKGGNCLRIVPPEGADDGRDLDLFDPARESLRRV